MVKKITKILVSYIRSMSGQKPYTCGCLRYLSFDIDKTFGFVQFNIVKETFTFTSFKL